MKKDEAINIGRHQIADPMEKEIARLHDAVSNMSEVYEIVEDDRDIVLNLVAEGKDKTLGIERMVSFANLSEEHDQFVVLGLVNAYYKKAISSQNRTVVDLISGLNEIASIVSVSGEILKYSSIEETEDKDIASKLLFEIVCLCNAYAGEYNEIEFEQLTEELTISVKDLKKIAKYISGNIQTYSLNKWLELLTGDIKDSDEIYSGTEEAFKREVITGEEEKIQEYESFTKYSEEYDFILDTLKSMPGAVNTNTKGWISDSGKNLSLTTAVAVYSFPKTEALFTLTGLHFIGSDGSVWSMQYDDYDENNSFVTKASSDGYYDVYNMKKLSGGSIKFCVEKDEEPLIRELLVGLKMFVKPSIEEVTIFSSLAKKEEYSALLIMFLKMGDLDPFVAFRKISEVLGFEQEDEQVFCKLLDYCGSIGRITKEEFINCVESWLLSQDLASRYASVYYLLRDLVFEVQIATGKTRTFNGLYASVLGHIYDTFLGESSYEEMLEIMGMQYRCIQENVDVSALRKARNNINKIESLTFSQIDVWSFYFWSEVDNLLKSDYGIFTSEKQRSKGKQQVLEKGCSIEEFYYMKLVGHINIMKPSKDKTEAYSFVERIISREYQNINAFGKLLHGMLNELHNEHCGPIEMIQIWWRLQEEAD